jgi:NitT/TauT family transport system ATP-binding protein
MPGVVGLHGLEKRFPARARGAEVHALGHIDLAVAPDEVVALVGPSGCGKSTLLRILAGLTPPSAGRVEVAGQPLWAGGRVDRRAMGHVALVFQEANLLPWMSIEANVAFPLRLRGVRRAERLARARELCGLTGISGFERRRPAELSVGMRQRAAIARGLIEAPDVLLLDEPFAALDAILREQLNLELQRLLVEQPRAVVLVTHSIPEAVFLGDRVVTFTSRPGRIAGITPIPFPRPRALELEHSAPFQAKVAEVRALLASGT